MPLSYAPPFSLTPFSLRPAPHLLRLLRRPCPLLRLSLLSYTFPALSYAPPFSLVPFSYATPSLLRHKALLVHLTKEVQETRNYRPVKLRKNLHLTRCSEVPENVVRAAQIPM